MKNDNIDDLFKKLQGNLDTEEPKDGHQLRFLEKLNAVNGNKTITTKKNSSWLTWASMAAAIALLVTVGIFQVGNYNTKEEQVAQISPEVSKTQFYFANLIEEQVKELNSEKSPETEKIINDTMLQLQKLQQDYTKMEQDLLNGGNSKLILSAMITNFQTRIELLKEVMSQIENIKSIKNTHDANYTI
ncbi:hypothetical protein SAMN04488009_3747 [Maribacter sedimenticola]|uniref:Anti-sigma factor n=1 Tax=Maribacter sedimenticola TaxID=228956 RepID=A0ABY1SLT7_9FLAO|nr:MULTISPECIES: hypothetical protein [Maribacter]TVZ15001.1 hypothetical protein JM81_1220 [Maribacter sp. MAR_2009_72]SNR77808.1 hypothetical protein SAMN04488009_3747 [Maribacter sedimenticola]